VHAAAASAGVGFDQVRTTPDPLHALSPPLSHHRNYTHTNTHATHPPGGGAIVARSFLFI
jgi:hypothetical protein